MEIEIRPVSKGDVPYLLANMRRYEKCAQDDFVRLLLKHSIEIKVAVADGKIAAAWGVIGDIIGPVVPWLLTTPLVERYPIRFFRESRRQVEELIRRYGPLDGFVECGFKQSISWIEWLGGEFDEGEVTLDSGVKARTFKWQ